MAVSIAHAFAVVLIDRVPSCAARASAPTWSTPGRPWRKARRLSFDRGASSYGGSGPAIGRTYADGASGSSTWVMRVILLWPVDTSRRLLIRWWARPLSDLWTSRWAGDSRRGRGPAPVSFVQVFGCGGGAVERLSGSKVHALAGSPL